MKAESSKMGATRNRKRFKPDDEAFSPDTEGLSVVLNEAVTKSKRPQKKGNHGKLAGLMDLPLDVLFEIFGHLKPFDLLKLARMTKEFRRLLMHKSSLSVWKSAREGVPGLPECPDGMTEPQWANLVFDPHCHFCFTTSVRTVEWALRVRICAKCSKEHLGESFTSGISVILSPDLDVIDPTTLVPHRKGRRHREVYLIRDYEAVAKEFKSIEGREAQIAFINERKKIVDEIMDHASTCETYAEGQLFDRSTELQQLKDERRIAIIQKLESLGYAKDIASIRYPDSLADHKLVKVPKRLTERVWKNIEKPMITFMEEMRVKRLEREYTALIAERKNTAVRVLRTYKNAQLPYTDVMPEPPDYCAFPPIKAIIEQPREVEVDEASFSEILPLLPDLIESWRGKISRRLAQRLHPSQAPERTRLSHLARMLLMCGSEGSHSEDDEENEVDGLPSAGGSNIATSNDENLAKLKLATTVFQCKSCTDPVFWLEDIDADSDSDGYYDHSPTSRNPLFYPNVLGHLCSTRTIHRMWSWPKPAEAFRRLDYNSKTRRPWNPRPLQLDERAKTYTEVIVREAGLNPATATVEEMDELDLWFACIKCPTQYRHQGLAETMAYKWRDAVAHHSILHGCRMAPRWRALTQEELDNVRFPQDTPQSVEDGGGSDDSDVSDDDSLGPGLGIRHRKGVWLCAHCRDLPSEKEPAIFAYIINHVKTIHGIHEPEIDKDYYKDFASHYPSSLPCRVILDI